MRSSVLAKEFLSEIRHEINQAHKSKEFPNQLLLKWSHKDICEAVLRLGGHINQLYRANGTCAITTNVGVYQASAAHTSESTTVTIAAASFTPDALIGGSVMTVVSDVFYAAQITDNDGTTLTISRGADLPVMTTDPVMITMNNAKKSALLTGLDMIHYAEPVWQILDGSGNPIENIDINEARNILNDPMMDDEAFYYILGESVQLALGVDKDLSGNLTVGFYELPTEATALTAYIDFPQEWHDLVQQRVMIRVQKKLGNIQSAQEKETDLERRWQEIEAGNMNAATIDRETRERK